MSRTRGFEIISAQQLAVDFGIEAENAVRLREEITAPRRGTPRSAAYDIRAVRPLTLFPGETAKVPTGLKAYMADDEYLAVLIRSSQGFKHNIRLMNQVGVIDADYYNNASNEGHIFVALQNQGQEVWHLDAGKAFAQAIFMKYLLTDDDAPAHAERSGGIGSTDRRD